MLLEEKIRLRLMVVTAEKQMVASKVVLALIHLLIVVEEEMAVMAEEMVNSTWFCIKII